MQSAIRCSLHGSRTRLKISHEDVPARLYVKKLFPQLQSQTRKDLEDLWGEKGSKGRRRFPLQPELTGGIMATSSPSWMTGPSSPSPGTST